MTNDEWLNDEWPMRTLPAGIRHSSFVLRHFLSAATMAVIVGCGQAATVDSQVSRVEGQEPEINSSAGTPALDPQPSTLDPSPALRVTGAEGYEETLAQLRGKVVLVDFWATWCAPCIEQFPHTVALHRKYEEQGLAVVGVSLNEPVEAPQVREFLAGQGAKFENLLSKYESGVQAIAEFGLSGPIPCYRVYDREGALRREFVVDPRAERQYTPEDIEQAVLKFL